MGTLNLGTNGLDNKNTIENAIADAEFGDTICLPAGGYPIQGQINLYKDGVTLHGLTLVSNNVTTPSKLWFYVNDPNYTDNIGPSNGIIIGDTPTTGSSFIVDEINQNGFITSNISLKPGSVTLIPVVLVVLTIEFTFISYSPGVS